MTNEPQIWQVLYTSCTYESGYGPVGTFDSPTKAISGMKLFLQDQTHRIHEHVEFHRKWMIEDCAELEKEGKDSADRRTYHQEYIDNYLKTIDYLLSISPVVGETYEWGGAEAARIVSCPPELINTIWIDNKLVTVTDDM